MTTNVMIRDMDLPVPEARGGRRIEIVADGLPLFGGAQFAVDVTLVGPRARARLIVLAGEVGGRSSQAWRLRWGTILACLATRAFASSLLDVRTPGAADGEIPPSHEVVTSGTSGGLVDWLP